MYDMGFKTALISCYDTNFGSIHIIENNFGNLIETIQGDGSKNSEHLKTRRYKIDIEASLQKFYQNQKIKSFNL